MSKKTEWIKGIQNEPNNPNINPFEYMERDDIIEINIPNGIKSIGEGAFSKCKNLKKVIIPDSVTTIGASAFSYCENLEEINLINSTSIAPETFSNCKKLKIVRLPFGMKTIGERAFYNCEKLSKINLPGVRILIRTRNFTQCDII